MNKKAKIKKMIALVVLVAISIITTVIVSCKRDNLEQEQNAQFTENYDEFENIDMFYESTFKITGVFLRDDDPQEWGISVGTNESAACYYIPSFIKDYDKYLSMLRVGSLLDSNSYDNIDEIIYVYTISNEETEHGHPILKIEYPTDSERETFMDNWYSNQQTFEDDDISSEKLSNTMTLQQANSFFQQFVNLSCVSCGYNVCIPFQYATDGCYARAHYMRKIMYDAGYSSKKLFAEKSGTIPLTANTNAGCCVAWRWHVAPLVYITTGNTTQEMVLDPSLFNGPVLKSVWINKLKSNCKGYGTPSINETVKNGSIYKLPNETDPDYINTLAKMDEYRECFGCTPCNGKKELV